MKLVIIFGPQAVGKMTVGQELAKTTELKLFHGHMTIELVNEFFSYGTPKGTKLVKLFRQAIFEEVADSDLYGLIFTYCWAFNYESDWEYVKSLTNLFRSKGSEIYFVELEADLEQRLCRNKSENRLAHKPSKRRLEWSENELLESMDQYRLNSNPGEITEQNYLRINNTDISAERAAQMIKERFSL